MYQHGMMLVIKEKKTPMAPDFYKTSRIGEQLFHAQLSYAECPGS